MLIFAISGYNFGPMDSLKKHISAQEKILQVGKVSKVIYFPGILSLIASLLFMGITPILSLFFICQGAFFLFNSSLVQFSNEYVVTNKRLLAKKGLRKPIFFELPYKMVKTVGISQSLFGKIFNFGDIIIHTTANEYLRIENLNDPIELRNKTILILDKIYDT